MNGLLLLLAGYVIFTVSLVLTKSVYAGIFITTAFTMVTTRYMSTAKRLPRHIKIGHYITLHEQLNYRITVLSLLMFLILEPYIGYNAALIIGYFIFSFLLDLPSRSAYVVALNFFLVTAVSAALDNQLIAEQAAVIAYYFVITGVILEVADMVYNRIETHTLGISLTRIVTGSDSIRSGTIMRRGLLAIGCIASAAAIYISAGIIVSKVHPQPGASSSATETVSVITDTPVPRPPRQAPPVPASSARPRVLIANGSRIAGRARRVADNLERKGWTNRLIISVGNADRLDYEHSSIACVRDWAIVAARLQSDLAIPGSFACNGALPGGQDIIITLGGTQP